jgi:hypothetical protein
VDKQKVRVCVRDWDDDFTSPLAEFIAELSKLLASIPEEFRDRAVLNFERYAGDYESSRGQMDVSYERLETDEEVARRKAMADASARDQAQRELRELARLAAKYGLQRKE